MLSYYDNYKWYKDSFYSRHVDKSTPKIEQRKKKILERVNKLERKLPPKEKGILVKIKKVIKQPIVKTTLAIAGIGALIAALNALSRKHDREEEQRYEERRRAEQQAYERESAERQAVRNAEIDRWEAEVIENRRQQRQRWREEDEREERERQNEINRLTNELQSLQNELNRTDSLINELNNFGSPRITERYRTLELDPPNNNNRNNQTHNNGPTDWNAYFAERRQNARQRMHEKTPKWKQNAREHLRGNSSKPYEQMKKQLSKWQNRQIKGFKIKGKTGIPADLSGVSRNNRFSSLEMDSMSRLIRYIKDVKPIEKKAKDLISQSDKLQKQATPTEKAKMNKITMMWKKFFKDPIKYIMPPIVTLAILSGIVFAIIKRNKREVAESWQREHERINNFANSVRNAREAMLHRYTMRRL